MRVHYKLRGIWFSAFSALLAASAAHAEEPLRAPGGPAPAAPPAETPAAKPVPAKAAPAKPAPAAAKPATSKPAPPAAKPAAPPAAKPAAPPAAKPAAPPAKPLVVPGSTTPPVTGAPPAAATAAALAPPAAAAASKDEVGALRAEVRALREELKRTVGAPEQGAQSPERARLEGELAAEHKKLAAIQAAVAGGLDRESVADSMSRVEARIAELEAAIAALPKAEALPTPTLYEVANKVERLDAQPPRAAAEPLPESEPKVKTVVEMPTKDEEKPTLLPLEFTAFGDFYYVFSRPDADDFHVGAVELDAALSLTPYVNVSTAIAYAGDDHSFGLGAFVIDCGIAGDGDEFLLKSKLVQKLGVSFGQFDVPFGIAYLEYPSVENRLVTQPQAVEATHAAWNDVGAQGYAIGEHWTAVAYLVNGQEYPTGAESTAQARTALGGRASAKVDDLFELGGSVAANFGAKGNAMTFAGGDVTGLFGPLDLRGEYLLKHVDADEVPSLTHGIYGRALARFEPAFGMARYDVVLEDSATVDRRISFGGGVEVFSQGEVRAVYEQSFDTDLRTVTLQLVGGSSFQPTGLRR